MAFATPKTIGIVSLPFEVTTSFRKGTLHGPATILTELDHQDSFELRLGRNPFEGIERNIFYPHTQDLVDPKIQIVAASRVVGEILDGGGFPICLGGEHTVSIGPVKAAAERGPIGVVQLDAHADLRDTYEGNPYSHACVMRRIHDMGCPALAVGIRSMSEPEAHFAREHAKPIISAREFIEKDTWRAQLDALPHDIYLTIDIDFFDPSDVPAVGTPEPGGPAYEATCAFLEALFQLKNVVAADIVELMPCRDDAASVRLASRLLGLLVGWRFPTNR